MSKPRHVRRGIYLLPTLFTVGNLLCGYSSIVQSSIGRMETAALMILFAAVLDGLDASGHLSTYRFPEGNDRLSV